MTELVLEVTWATKIYGKGTVVCGKVACEKVKIGTVIQIEDAAGNVLQNTYKEEGKTFPLRIVGIEIFNKIYTEVQGGTECCLLLRGVAFTPEKGARVTRHV